MHFRQSHPFLFLSTGLVLWWRRVGVGVYDLHHHHRDHLEAGVKAQEPYVLNQLMTNECTWLDQIVFTPGVGKSFFGLKIMIV